LSRDNQRPTGVRQTRTHSSLRTACGDACLFDELSEVDLIRGYFWKAGAGIDVATLVDVTAHAARRVFRTRTVTEIREVGRDRVSQYRDVSRAVEGWRG